MVFDKWHLGVTFGFRGKNGYFSSEEAKEEARAIKESGADWVVLVVTVFQENYASRFQFMDFEMTPDSFEVAEMIDYLHSLGLKVQLRPMLETMDGCGRLQVWFPRDDLDGNRIPGTSHSFCSDWFRSMTARSVYYAKIAERTKCEMFCLDSELDRFINYNEEWSKVVDAVREVYHGVVTSCHTTHVGLIDYEKTLSKKDHWFYKLDVLSLSTYHYCANKPGATKEEMKEGFKSQLERFRRMHEIYGKPILLGECGCTTISGAAMNADGWKTDKGTYDEKEQATYLEALIETFEGEPWWYGLYWWKWDENVPRPFKYKGFTIKGKMSEQVFRQWSIKDRSRK